jgi:uncharacterized protein (DUF2147 family)
MKPAFALAIALMLLTMGSVHAAPLPTISGFWETDDDEGQPQAWFFFEEKEKDGPWVGHLVKGFKKPGEKFVDTCTKCTGDQKNAKMLGLAMVNGMKRDGLTYKEGTILDPRDGSVYHAEMELSADGKELAVRGYIGLPIFGKTQIWKRLPDDAIPAADMAKILVASSPKQIAASPAPKKTPKPTSTNSPASSNSSVDPAPGGDQ